VHILLIEDSSPTRDLLRRSLQESGHRLSTAARLSSGRAAAIAERFDVIVIDIMLPDGSGIDLCREIRDHGVETPILFLTARGDVADRIAGLDAGADDYMRKPFALAELQARLRALARRGGHNPPTLFKWSGGTVDFRARRLMISGREIPLTAREWKVLEILAEHTGRIVSRDDLLEGAWGEIGSRASESLDVIMSRLRRKLGSRDGRDWIRTVRGEGYVLDGPS